MVADEKFTTLEGQIMLVRRRGNALERWEVALIKAMIDDGRWTNDQDILAYFTRPTRSVNHRAIGEVRTRSKHGSIKSASADELQAYLSVWPDIDPQTGLSKRGDELLIKAREAMIAAVHVFNSSGITFRAELFIVSSIIAWTYLLHAWYKREGIDYRYTRNEKGKRVVVRTPTGATKYWELQQCLNHAKCPIELGAKSNLEFLLEIRHEIEHRSTDRIDEALSAKLQACCLNFNATLKTEFGSHFSLEGRIPIALQFVSLSADQRQMLKGQRSLPKHIQTAMETFENKLTAEQKDDPKFAYRVYMFRKTANRNPSADFAVELIEPDSEVGERFGMALKEVEKRKYLPSQIVNILQSDGHKGFGMHQHTELWKRLDAKNPAKNYGAIAVGKQWCWYETWLNRAREECEQNPDLYR